MARFHRLARPVSNIQRPRWAGNAQRFVPPTQFYYTVTTPVIGSGLPLVQKLPFHNTNTKKMEIFVKLL